jgi:hypothetical protein
MPLLAGLRSHLCSWNASKASADGAKAVGTARGIKSLHPQRRQPHPIKNGVCIQTSAFPTSATSAIMSSKWQAVTEKSHRHPFSPVLARIVTKLSIWRWVTRSATPDSRSSSRSWRKRSELETRNRNSAQIPPAVTERPGRSTAAIIPNPIANIIALGVAFAYARRILHNLTQ